MHLLSLEMANQEEKDIFLKKKNNKPLTVETEAMNSKVTLSIILNTWNKEKAIKSGLWMRHASSSSPVNVRSD